MPGVIGISDHGGWAVLVTATGDGALLDRRRVELVDEGLAKLPHHTEGQALPLEAAVRLVERVRESAERHALLAVDAVLAGCSGSSIRGVALRALPEWLPATIEERIRDYRSQNVADWVMYRRALAGAAEARGLAVHWYEAKQALAVELKCSFGPPWSKDYRLAYGAAVLAAGPTLLAGGNPQIAKADGDAPVQAYIAAMPGWKRDVGRRIDSLIERAAPGVRKAVKWNSPFYGTAEGEWFLGFHCLTKYVKVAFFRGADLRPAPPVSSKNKDTRYLHIYEDGVFDEARFVQWVEQAFGLGRV